MSSLPTPYPHAETIDRFVHTGDLESAHGLAREWTRQEPQSLGAWVALASVLERQGDRRHAIDALEEAIKISPEQPSLYFKVGVHRYALQEFQNAAFAFMASLAASARLEDSAHDTLAALALAQTHVRLGQVHEAVLLLRQLDDDSTMWMGGRITPKSIRELIRTMSKEAKEHA